MGPLKLAEQRLLTWAQGDPGVGAGCLGLQGLQAPGPPGRPTKPQGLSAWRSCLLGSPPPSPASVLSLLCLTDKRNPSQRRGTEYLQEMDRLSLESMTCVSSVMFRVGGLME